MLTPSISCQLGVGWGQLGVGWGGSTDATDPNRHPTALTDPQPTPNRPNRHPTNPTAGRPTRSAWYPPILRVLNPFLNLVWSKSEVSGGF